MGRLTTDKIDVIVVGAGFGGLSSAIELARKGARVRVFELAKDLTRQGDVIMIGSNANRIVSKWGTVMDELLGMASQPSFLSIRDKHGKKLLEQPLPKDFEGFPNIYTNRTKAQNLMYEHALSLGVEFTFGARIKEYFESDTHAGIIHDGEKITADLVIGADSVHSRARVFVTGSQEKAQKSGFAVFRSWFSLDRLKEHPLTKDLATSTEDKFIIFIAEDIHAIITTNVKLQTVTCFATHKDNTDIEESWHLKASVSEMLEVVQDWDPVLIQTVKSIPEDVLIDHKLLWRDPVPKWVSEKGRIVLVGDAAHPHLATSGTGGAQAIEDGATIAALLDLAGRERLVSALKAYQRLRFERTSITQRMGWETRHRWHQTDWEEVAKNPDFLKLPQPAWLNGHDAEQYAIDQFEAVLKHIEAGAEFQSTNIPEGHVHEDWSIGDMMAKEGIKGDVHFYQVDNQ